MALLRPTAAPVLYPKLPDQPALVILLRELLDRDVTMQRGEPDGRPGYTALYVDREGSPATTIAFDLSLAATAGGALALIPTGQCEEAIAAGPLEGELLDNSAEVLNVLASAFNTTDESRHVKLLRVESIGEAPSDEVTLVATTAAARARYDVAVDGYPGGSITLMAR